jgi:hypothetical protein
MIPSAQYAEINDELQRIAAARRGPLEPPAHTVDRS